MHSSVRSVRYSYVSPRTVTIVELIVCWFCVMFAWQIYFLFPSLIFKLVRVSKISFFSSVLFTIFCVFTFFQPRTCLLFPVTEHDNCSVSPTNPSAVELTE